MGFEPIDGAIDRFNGVADLNRPKPITAGEQLKAAFQLENIPVNVFNAATREQFDADPDFNPLDQIQNDDLLFASQLSRADSLEEFQEIKTQIAREQKAREVLGSGPINSFLAASVAILADPTTFLGFGIGAISKGARGVKIAKAGGAAAVETGVAEGALQATQETRTARESLTAIMLGGAFGVGIGTVGAALTAKAHRRAVKDFMAVMDDADAEINTPRSVGAAAPSDRLTPGESQVVRIKGVAKAVSKLRGVVAPNVELAASRLHNVRTVAGRLFDTVLVTEGNVNFKSSGASVDTRIKRYDAVRAASLTSAGAHFKNYRSRVGKANALSRKEFQDAAGKALRRGDVDQIPEVQELARWYRKHVFDPLKERAIKEGMLPKDVSPTTAVSYFTRVYNRDKILSQSTEFLDRVENYIRREVGNTLEEAEYRDAAMDIMNNIVGAPSARVPFINTPLQAGPFKERTFNIPDVDIEDFLESDVTKVSDRFMNTVVPDIELTREFGRVDLDSQIKDIRDEANTLADGKKTEKERLTVFKEAKRSEELTNALVQMTRNQFDVPTDGGGIALRRAGKIIRDFNYLRLLGSVMLSSIPDIGRIVMEEGLARSFGALLADTTTGFKGFRMALKEAQMAGTALDITMATRAKAMYDLGEQFQTTSAVERVLDSASNKFGIANLLSPWNVALKSWASVMIGNRILKATKAAADGTISKSDTERLARAGINRETAIRISKQSEHWEDNGAVLLAGTQEWTDASAVDAFRNALLRDVDNTVVTPSAADAPIWTSKAFGKTIFQFKRFASASVNRIMLGGIQKQDMAALNGVLLMVALGSASTALRDISSTGGVKDRTKRQWMAEGLDRSGALGLLTEMDAISDKALGVSAMRTLAGEDESTSRIQSRNLLGQLGGPFAGAIQDAGKAARAITEGDFTQSDARKLRRLAPGQNLFYIRALLDKLEKSLPIPEDNRKR